jgi:hypothetical protein
LDVGKYLFGSRNIIAKIVNGRLLIRVGGGFMNVDEFIEQYGKVEMLKFMKAQGDPMADQIIKQGGAARHSVVGDNYAKLANNEVTNNLLSAANVYQGDSTAGDYTKSRSPGAKRPSKIGGPGSPTD